MHTEILAFDGLVTASQAVLQETALPAAAFHVEPLARLFTACGAPPAREAVNDATLADKLSAAMARADVIVVAGGKPAWVCETVCKALSVQPKDGAGVHMWDAAHFVISRYAQTFFILPSALPPAAFSYAGQLFSKGTAAHTAGIFGLSAAAARERLGSLLETENPFVQVLDGRHGCAAQVAAWSDDESSAAASCDAALAAVREKLGIYVYGVDSGNLQQTVVAQLKDKGLHIATAESCTAGMLSGALTEVPGASAVFEYGVSAYSNEVKQQTLGVPPATLDQYGAVSAQTAKAMAVGVRGTGHADIGVSVTGEAGPTSSEGKDVGTVYIALADERQVWVKKLLADGGDREFVRGMATLFALDLTRRYLDALPARMAGSEALVAAPEEKEIPQAQAVPQKKPLPAYVLPWRGDSRAELTRKTGLLLAILIVLAVGVWAAVTWALPAWNRNVYTDLGTQYGTSGVSMPANAPDGMLTSFASLFQSNNDLRGWIKIPDTSIDYPIVQWRDDLDYRTVNFLGQPSALGTPYFNRNVALLDKNSHNRVYTVYGNNVNGQMFADLCQYADMNYFTSHPLIQMDTLYQTGKWKVFAVLYLGDDTLNDFSINTNYFADNDTFDNFVYDIQKRSLFTTPYDQSQISDDTSLVAVVTDAPQAGFKGARIAVIARSLEPGESEDADMTDTVPNDRVLMPVETQETVTTGPSDSATATASSEAAVSTTGAASTAAPTTRPTTAAPTTQPSTTAAPTVGTTTTTTTVTTTTSAGAVPAPATGTILAGTYPESAFIATCKVTDTNTGITYAPQTQADLQNLISQVVYVEMGSLRMSPNGNYEAQKAQAVAAYTYILWYNKTYGAPYPMGLKSLAEVKNSNPKLYDAVGTVVGIKILDTSYTGVANVSKMPVQALYSYSNCGVSASADTVWNMTPVPYLKSVASPYDTDIAQYGGVYETTAVVKWSTIQSYMASTFPQNLTWTGTGDFGCPFYGVAFQGDYVTQINAKYGATGSTTPIKGKAVRDATGIRSHAFKIVAYNAVTGEATLNVFGWGHGVGMSQYGAVGFADKQGWTFEQILKHYYSLTDSGVYRLVAPVW